MVTVPIPTPPVFAPSWMRRAAARLGVVDRSEVLSAVLIAWCGMLLTIGGPAVSNVLLGAIAPTWPWGDLMILIGAPQVVGMVLYSLGARERRRARVWAIGLTGWLWASLAIAQLLSANPLLAIADLVFAMVSYMNFYALRTAVD